MIVADIAKFRDREHWQGRSLRAVRVRVWRMLGECAEPWRTIIFHLNRIPRTGPLGETVPAKQHAPQGGIHSEPRILKGIGIHSARSPNQLHPSHTPPTGSPQPNLRTPVRRGWDILSQSVAGTFCPQPPTQKHTS